MNMLHVSSMLYRGIAVPSTPAIFEDDTQSLAVAFGGEKGKEKQDKCSLISFSKWIMGG